MEFEWSRSATEHLIKLLKQNGCLWDRQCKFYNNALKHEEAIAQICANLKNELPDITEMLVQEKIDFLMSQYRREFRLLSTSKSSVCSLEGVRKTHLWCFDLLHFLKRNLKVHRTVSNLQIAPPNTQNTSEQWDEDDLPCSSYTKTNDATIPKHLMVNTNLGKEENYRWIADLIVPILANIHFQEIADNAVKEIIGIVKDCQLKDNARKNKDLLAEAMEGIFDDDDFE